MQKNIKNIEKPRAEIIRHEITRLPELTEERLRYREKWAARCRWLVRRFTRTTITGLENFPSEGPGLIVSNHLGDMDLVLGLAALPVQPDGIGKAELFDLPIAGRWLDRYGLIWIHRGTADRKAIRCALDGLAEGRFVAIAPEGRQSVTGALEEATGGAAFIALKAGAPVIPVAMTGTESANVYGSWLRLKRPKLTFSIGKPLLLDELEDGRKSVEQATNRIMQAIAAILPEGYRGAYNKD